MLVNKMWGGIVMGNFITYCGKKFEENHDCFMSAVIIEQLYPDEMKKESRHIAEKCKVCLAEKRQRSVQRIDFDTNQTFVTQDTICFAKNKEFKEYKALPEQYEGASSNLLQKIKMEYVFQTEDYRAIISKEDTSRGASFFECIEDDIAEIYDLMVIDEDAIHSLKMISLESGRVDDITFDNLDDFKDTLISARLVEYSSEIIEEE